MKRVKKARKKIVFTFVSIYTNTVNSNYNTLMKKPLAMIHYNTGPINTEYIQNMYRFINYNTMIP